MRRAEDEDTLEPPRIQMHISMRCCGARVAEGQVIRKIGRSMSPIIAPEGCPAE